MRILCVKAIVKLLLVFTLWLCLDCSNGRTIDSTTARASGLGTYKSAMNGDTQEGAVITELDMLLTREQYNALHGKKSTSKMSARKKREAPRPLSSRWPNKRVPYRIQPYHFSSKDYQEIRRAIDDWEKYTCITFPPATRYDFNFINFEEDGEFCQSLLGMSGGKQSIFLRNDCKNKQAITHELGHAIGFIHEHSRPDRDYHVIINHKNVKPDSIINFSKYVFSEGTNFGVPYDYTSIMHYNSTLESRNGKTTIVTKDPAFQNIIGQQDRLSFNDIKLANLMYNCNEQCRSSRRCPKEGFLGKDCRCWCPGNPVKECEENIDMRREPTTKCRDMDPDCPALAELGYCRRSSYVDTFCKASCFLCEGDIATARPPVKRTRKPTRGPTTRPTKRPSLTTTCADTDPFCPVWAALDYCNRDRYVNTHCKASCSLCYESRLFGLG